MRRRSASSPSPVVAETRTPRSPAGRRSALLCTTKYFASVAETARLRRRRRARDPRPAAPAPTAPRLRLPRRRPCRAGPPCRRASPAALEVDDLGHQVARRPWPSVTIARDEPTSALKGSTCRRSAGRRWPPAVLRERAARDGRRRAAPSCARRKPSRRAATSRLDEVIALVGKVDRRFEPRDQIEERRVELARSSASACLPADRTRAAPVAASPRR